MAYNLAKYEAARAALEAATKIDEVKLIHDKAVAVATYVKLAKDNDMVNWAVEIKVRAERRAGELLKAMTKNTGAKGIGASAVLKKDHTPTLAKLGISKNDSSLWQKLATMPASTFEQILAVVKAKGGKLTTKAVLAVTKPGQKEKEQPDMGWDVDEIIQRLSKRWPEWTKRSEILEMLSNVSACLASFVKDSKDWTDEKRSVAFDALRASYLKDHKGKTL